MQVAGWRARTSNAGASPDSSDGWPNASPGSSTSITSPSWISSTEPVRITYRCVAGAPSSCRIVSPAAKLPVCDAGGDLLEVVVGERGQGRE